MTAPGSASVVSRVAREAFDAGLATSTNRRQRLDVGCRRRGLLRLPDGAISSAGLRTNIDVGCQYLAAWLGGTGCVPLYH